MIEPRIYYDMPFAEYCGWPAINNSVLACLMGRSPLHAKVMIDGQREDTPSLSFGRAFHTATLEPELFDQTYTVAPKIDRRTKDGKARWAAFQAASDGKELLSDDDYQTLKQMASSVRNSPAIDCITNGKSEVSIVWEDEATGLLCKMRIDYLHKDRGFLVDLKTTRDASPDGFSRAMFTYRYHQQAAFYMAGFKSITKTDESLFLFVAIEKTAPYASAIYEVAGRTIQAGENAYKGALIAYKECIESGVWPSYQKEVELIDMPAWALKLEGVSA